LLESLPLHGKPASAPYDSASDQSRFSLFSLSLTGCSAVCRIPLNRIIRCCLFVLPDKTDDLGQSFLRSSQSSYLADLLCQYVHNY
jgi:hypothetical protein